MRHPIPEASAWMMVAVLAIGAVSNAQIPKPEDGAAVVKEADVYSSQLGDGSGSQETYLSSPENNAHGHPQPGFISGTVLDQTGAVSLGAEVCLTRKDQSATQEVKSGSNGQFLFTGVAPGYFRLTVTSPGFATGEFSAALRPGETYLVPTIMLVVAAAVTEVHVNVSPLTPVQVSDLQIKEQEKQRVLGFIPNFYVNYNPNALPLNPRQKFRLAWKTTFDPFTFVGVGALAGVKHATNAFAGYGQGAQGYAKRFAASYTDAVTGTFIGSALLPSLLKQDPRYFYKGTGSTGSRLLYALASPLICKGDNMRWQPNYSNIAGAFASGGISYFYYPKSDRNGAGLVFQNASIRLGEMAFEGMLQEFVIRRLTPHVRKREGLGTELGEPGSAATAVLPAPHGAGAHPHHESLASRRTQ
jgi:hypothetical protein